MNRPKKRVPLDLRESCIAEALRIVESQGIEALSLREVARRLGVSHGAPYRHFTSRDHICAELVSRAFDDFAHHLESRRRTGEPELDLEEMGKAYLSYAVLKPLNYRLMFGSKIPDPKNHPEMMQKAQHAFEMLKDGLRAVHSAAGRMPTDELLQQDALYVWATMHGLAGVLTGEAVKQTSVSSEILSQLPSLVFARLSAALRETQFNLPVNHRR